MALAQSFTKQVNGIVANETKAWAAEFTTAVKQLDEQIKEAGQASGRAAVQVSVANGDQCKSGWKLTVDGGIPEDRSGKETSVSVPPGLHVVRATGEIAGKSVRDAQPVDVAPGAIAQVKLTLV